MSHTWSCSPDFRLIQNSGRAPLGRGRSVIQVVRRIQCGPSTSRAPAGLGSSAAETRRGVADCLRGPVGGRVDAAGAVAADGGTAGSPCAGASDGTKAVWGARACSAPDGGSAGAAARSDGAAGAADV